MSQRRRRNAVTTGGGNRSGIIIFAATVAAILVIGGLLVAQELLREEPGYALADQGNYHLAEPDEAHVSYNSSPPTSGPHMPGLAPAQIYNEQVPDEFQVHNLEDGFVNVQYDCPDGCPDLVAQLTDVVNEYIGEPEGRILMGPYAGITDPVTGQSRRIALTAWTRLDAFDEFDVERIRAFIDAYMGIDHHVP